jgi:hypothetical protein
MRPGRAEVKTVGPSRPGLIKAGLTPARG